MTTSHEEQDNQGTPIAFYLLLGVMGLCLLFALWYIIFS
jgi:hypothetical protein